MHGFDELGADDQAVCVVRERAGLEADDVHPPDRFGRRHVPWPQDETVVDPVDILHARRVRQHDPSPAPELVQVPEHEPALGVRVAEPVAGDVDVRATLPGEARPLEVQRPVVQRRPVIRGARVDGDVFHPLHARDGQFHGRVFHGRRARHFPGPPDVEEHEPGGEQDQHQPDEHERGAVGPPHRPVTARSLTFAGPRFVRFGSHGRI